MSINKELIKVYTDKINQCLNLQDEFNRIVDDNWREHRSVYDWALATQVECSELIDSLPWKWWKKMDIDIDNIRVEIVDIFHFVLSALLQIGVDKVNESDIEKVLTGMETVVISPKLPEGYSTLEEFVTDRKFIRNYGALLNTLTTILYSLNDDNNDIVTAKHVILKVFLQACYPFITFDELIKLYIGKNALNKLRQDFGYKKGTYKKVWFDGYEDNAVMYQIVKETDIKDVTFEGIYNTLKDIYEHKVLKNNQ